MYGEDYNACEIYLRLLRATMYTHSYKKKIKLNRVQANCICNLYHPLILNIQGNREPWYALFKNAFQKHKHLLIV